MNTLRTLPTTPHPTPSKPPNAIAMPTRQCYREREFGVGYGTSDGYASLRRYADHRPQPRFRCT